MRIAIHHGDDGEAHTHFRGGNDHDKENKDLSVDARVRVSGNGRYMMHFRKRDQQQVDGIQHEFDAHENDDGIPARQYSRHSDTEECDA